MDKNKLFKGSTASILHTQEIKDKENQTDSNIHKIFFKKYEIKTKIGKSSSIQIYEGINLSNSTPVIIKLESRSNDEFYLELEALNLYLFKDLGIPKIITTGKTKSSIVLIEEKLGPSLYNLFIENKKKFSINEICCIGIQCIERLKGIHSKNYVHRNIKPENFRIGLKDPHVIYLQNFYLCEKFKSDTTNKHVKLSLTNKIVGTERYGSIDALRGIRQGRKDDLESLCYMLIYFFLGKLPWQDIKAETQQEKYKKLLNEKKKFNIDNYKDIIPKEFRTIFKLVKNLKFEEQPKYSLYIRLFQKIREENQCFDQTDFFWVKKSININIKKNNIKAKKEGFRERLYLKLNTMGGTDIRPVLEMDNEPQIGEYYIEDEYIDNDFNGKTDFKNTLISNFLIDDKQKSDKAKAKEDEKENKKDKNEEDKIDLNKSQSSNSSSDTKVYKLNGPIKNFLKNQMKDDDINKISSSNNSGKNDSLNREEVKQTITNKEKNKYKLGDIIEENIEEEKIKVFYNKKINKEENKNIIQENKIDSININDNITTNNSNHNSKTVSVSLTNDSNIKGSKPKDNKEMPDLIIIKKNSNEINKDKTISANNTKKENRFGQIMSPEAELEKKIATAEKEIKDKDKDCIIF